MSLNEVHTLEAGVHLADARRSGSPQVVTEDPGNGQARRASSEMITGSPGACAEARRLLDLFGEMVQQLVMLHEQQFLAVVEGDEGAPRFDLLIHEANEKKHEAKYAYLRHLDEHGCSLTNDADER